MARICVMVSPIPPAMSGPAPPIIGPDVLGGAAEAAPATGACIAIRVSLSPAADYRPPRLPIVRFPKTGFMVVRTAEPLVMPAPFFPPDLRIRTSSERYRLRLLDTESDTGGHSLSVEGAKRRRLGREVANYVSSDWARTH